MSRSLTCMCQVELSAEYMESLVAPVKAHFDREHPDLGLTETSVRNYLEGEDRLTGPVERLDDIALELFQRFGFVITSEEPLVVGPDL